MYGKMIRNDIRKSKLITFTTFAFVAIAAMLTSLAVILAIHLLGSINTLMTNAKTPHFLQMHAGVIDLERLENFAKNNEEVEDFQVLEFVNVEGGEIRIGDHTLAGSSQDNGFSVQSTGFDYLLNLDGEKLEVSQGEVFAPICYKKDGTLHIGDKLNVFGKDFLVKGFLRDSQMNASMASSKRFLVNESDLEWIKEKGSVEYLIEFRLKDISLTSKFENEYIANDLEANGPTLSYALFKMINAVSDGVMIAVILLVSFLITLIAFSCIRLTLLAKIEEDYREIGVMKGIGIQVKDIKKIYLAKYAVISAFGCFVGYLLSYFLQNKLLENIRQSMGESNHANLASLVGILGVILIFIVVILYVNQVLNRFYKLSAVCAIRNGESTTKEKVTKWIKVHQNKFLNTNILLGFTDMVARKKIYFTMIFVIILATFMIVVPQNLYQTISAKEFSAYMGVGECDLRVDIQQQENIEEYAMQIAAAMQLDEDIASYRIFTTKVFQVILADGLKERIKVELGDHGAFPVKYISGSEPQKEEEIALSTLNADELGVKIGDHLAIERNATIDNLEVCGIYSDITNGGKTAKALFQDDTASTMWSIISAKLVNPEISPQKVKEYKSAFHYAKVTSIDDYVKQTYGTMMNSILMASNISVGIAIFILVLITILFMKLLITKDKYSIAVLKSLGFTNRDIKMQYFGRSLGVLVIGISVGILLANTLGESLAGAMIASFGASAFQFNKNVIMSYLIAPLIICTSVLIATYIGTYRIDKVEISENIKE